jgi:hypothetical protein
MAQVSITQLPQAQALTGTESVPIVQNGVTVQTTTGAISGAGALNYPFLTVGSTAGLTQAREIAVGSGLSLVDNGAGYTLEITMTGAAASLNTSGVGIQVKTGPNTLTPREITVGGGMTVSNGDGVAGNPLIGLDTQLQNLSALSGIGLMTINGSTFSQTTLYGTTNQINVADGNAAGGAPTFSLASNPVLPGNGAVTVPSGTSVQRQDGNGNLRYNTTLSRFEGYQGGAWTSFGVGDGTVTSVSGVAGQIAVTNPTTTPIIGLATNPSLPGTGSVLLPQGTTAERSAAGFGALRYNTDTASLEAYTLGIGWGAIISGSGVSTFSAGSTGLTPNTPTSGGIVLGGILNPASGGTGVNNGSYTVTLGGNISTAGALSTTGAYSLNFNVTSLTSITLPTTGTLATLAGSETLTNKTISGSNNTLSNIANSSLTNSSVTYNGVTVALGASGTITASNPNPLTIGTGLSGSSYDGSTPVTIAIDSSVVTLTGSQTLTNKSISGSSNTLTNIPNSALTNSSLSVNGTTISLGGSGTITANTTNTLTIGTGLSGTSFNGSSAVTIAIDSTVATLTGTQTLTNKSISGSTNTLTNIPNSALTNSSLTVGSTAISLGSTSLTLAGLTSVTLTQDPTLDLQAATKQYVDAKASTGLTYHSPVQAATTQSLAAQTGGTVTYNNGASGVGATITLSVALTTLDGYSLANTNRILVKDETNQAYNGVYTWATGGTVLTRATDADTYGPNYNQLSQNDYFFVQNGTVNKGSSYVVTTVGTITFGTTAITFAEFSNSQVYSAGTGLTLTGTTFSISNTGVTNATYGTASSVPTIAVNAQGQITSASNTSIAINGNQITSGTVGSAYISGSYTGITGVGTLTAGTWNATTIGVAYGGTGLTSYATGDLIYASASATLSKLTLGTSGYVLTAGVSAPQYVAQSTLSVGSATNATNTTNVGITADSTNATRYLTFVSATSGNLPELVNSSITCNPSTGQITGGIAGGAF